MYSNITWQFCLMTKHNKIAVMVHVWVLTKFKQISKCQKCIKSSDILTLVIEEEKTPLVYITFCVCNNILDIYFMKTVYHFVYIYTKYGSPTNCLCHFYMSTIEKHKGLLIFLWLEVQMTCTWGHLFFQQKSRIREG